MRTLSVDAFLQWAASKGLHLNPTYPHSAELDFESGSETRFWTVPAAPERRPYFLATLIDLLGDWQKCYVWRHLGSWPDPARIDSESINDLTQFQILRGLGLPLGTADVIEFDQTDRQQLLTLLFSTTIFGWSVGDDLYIVPDHAQRILKTDHHNAIHLCIPQSQDFRPYINRMSQSGFPLPEELPDATFKQPTWMSNPSNRPLAPAYFNAVIVTFVLQFGVTPLLLLILDGSRLAKIAAVSMAGFWIAAATIMLRRPHFPQPTDLLFIRWGYLALLLFGIVIALMIK